MTMVYVQTPVEKSLEQRYAEQSRAGKVLDEKRAGQIIESAGAKERRARNTGRQHLSGLIPSKPVDAEKKKDDKADIIPPITTDVISGVIAATVSSNRMMPISLDESVWDVLASYYAIIGPDFSKFRLPHAGIKLGYYASGVMDAEFEDEDFELDPPKQNLFNARHQDSYAIQCVARCSQAGLDAILSASDSQVDVVSLRWAGPWASEEQYLVSVEIDDHVVPGVGRIQHTPGQDNVRFLVPPVEVVEPTDHALIDITFMSISGGKWQAFLTRIR